MKSGQVPRFIFTLGPGLLTRSLLAQPEIERLICIEKDQRFKPILLVLNSNVKQLQEASKGRLMVFFGDALKFNYNYLNYLKFPSDSNFNAQEEKLVQIVGNLPFNISTPLLRLYLKSIYEKHFQMKFKADKETIGVVESTSENALQSSVFKYSLFSNPVELYLMFQREFAQRIVAKSGSDEFGRLSIISQLIMKPQIVLNLDNDCFVPKPKVAASVVKFVPNTNKITTSLSTTAQ